MVFFKGWWSSVTGCQCDVEVLVLQLVASCNTTAHTRSWRSSLSVTEHVVHTHVLHWCSDKRREVSWALNRKQCSSLSLWSPLVVWHTENKSTALSSHWDGHLNVIVMLLPRTNQVRHVSEFKCVASYSTWGGGSMIFKERTKNPPCFMWSCVWA